MLYDVPDIAIAMSWMSSQIVTIIVIPVKLAWK